MSDLLMTSTDLAELRALNAANLPHLCNVEIRIDTRQPGGTYTHVWNVEQSAVACRVAVVGTPAERLSAGALAEVKEFEIVFPYGTWVNPARRLVVTHSIPDLTSPLTLYPTGSPARTFEMQSSVMATTEGGQ